MLALIAGIVNAVGILGLEHQSVTHLTGTTKLYDRTADKITLEEIDRFRF